MVGLSCYGTICTNSAVILLYLPLWQSKARIEQVQVAELSHAAESHGWPRMTELPVTDLAFFPYPNVVETAKPKISDSCSKPQTLYEGFSKFTNNDPGLMADIDSRLRALVLTILTITAICMQHRLSRTVYLDVVRSNGWP
jgi:hypothetical protein